MLVFTEKLSWYSWNCQKCESLAQQNFPHLRYESETIGWLCFSVTKTWNVTTYWCLISFKRAIGYVVCIEFTGSAILINGIANYYSSTFFMTTTYFQSFGVIKEQFKSYTQLIMCCFSLLCTYIKATFNCCSVIWVASTELFIAWPLSHKDITPSVSVE